MINKQTGRRSFLKKSCLAGTCFCGFVQLSYSAKSEEQAPDSNIELMQQWISNVLKNINENNETEKCRTIMRKCAQVHFNHLNMSEVLKPFVGNLTGFIEFLEKEWGWSISNNKEAKVLLANENKNYCVCPMVNNTKGIKSSILCYCSEGFAELMFSKVFEKAVKTKVVSSIHFGDESCVYKVNY